MDALLDNPRFAEAYAELETISLNPRRNAPARWFIEEAEARGLLGDLRLDLPDLPSERCAGAALVHEGRALLIRVRASGYELPKGGLEFDELPGEAALRELREEAGLGELKLELGEAIGELSYRVDAGDEEREGYLEKVSYYRAHARGEPELGPLPPRTRERRWIAAAELDALPLIDESLRPLVRAGLSAG